MMLRSRTNIEWLQELQANGELQNAAIVDLRILLLRAAFYTFNRNLGDLANFSQEEIQQMAEDCAQEALLSILKSISNFRGESKFTTWAYKFAINISLTMARRERWKGVSLESLADQALEDGWFFAYMPKSTPDITVIKREIRETMAEVIHNELTDKQRRVLKLIVFDEVPMDVVVQHLNTNRNAVYKLLHDARRKLKRGLQLHGIGVGETIDLFGA